MGAHEQFVNRKKNNIGTTHSESGWPGLSNVRRGLHARIAICMRAVPRFSRAMAPVCVQSHVRARGSRVLTCTSRWHACSGAYMDATRICMRARLECLRATPRVCMRSDVRVSRAACLHALPGCLRAFRDAGMQSVPAHAQRRVPACRPACVHAESFASLHLQGEITLKNYSLN